MRTFVPKDVKLIPENAEKVFEGVIFDTYQWEQELFDGSSTTFEMLKRPDTVLVVAIKDSKIVILEQEQPHFGFFYDLPSGRHDVDGESELEGAKRELLEETGMKFVSWKLIHVDQLHTKIDWLRYTFLARDLEDEVEQNLEAGEKIKVTLKTFEEVKELMGSANARFVDDSVFKHVDSMEELLAMPELREI